MNNPYPGLRAFEYKERLYFFGREGRALEVAARLGENRFIAVVGTSGSGKSSLVRAGLLPLLNDRMVFRGVSHWRVAIMRPGDTPIRNLAESLVYPFDRYAEDVDKIADKDQNRISKAEAVLRRSGVGLLDFMSNAENAFDEGENLFILVDQFEEIFRFKEKSDVETSNEAAAFVKLLLEATANKASRIHIVITMRSDYLGDCTQFRDLPEAINDGQYLIPRLTREQLLLSIESPARVSGAQISPALVSRLLNDTGDDPDQLPILQHALMRIWNRWEAVRQNSEEPMDIKQYEDVGGWSNALSNHANEAYDELEDDGLQPLAQKIFKCLTEKDSENREKRRPAKLRELYAVVGAETDAQKAEVRHVIDVFRREGRTFLMPPPRDLLTDETKIDISHESLIRNWTNLNEWVRQEARDAAKYRKLAEDALEFEEFRQNYKDKLGLEEYEAQKKDFLWSGVLLKDIDEWWNQFQPNAAWASRYQMLTEAEQEELAELSRTVPKNSAARRYELNETHFHQTEKFLKDSKTNEIIELRKEERERWRKIWSLRALAVTLALLLLGTVFGVFYFLRQNAKLEQAQAELTKQNEALIKIKETLEEQNRELEENQRQLEQNQKELNDTNQELKDSQVKLEVQVQKVEEQKRIAEFNADKAKKAEAVAQNKADEAIRARNEADQKNSTLNSYREGLMLAEIYKFDEAVPKFIELEKNFDKLCEGNPNCGDDKIIDRWWAKYNLAQTYSQLGQFNSAQTSFVNTLDSLGYKFNESFALNSTGNLLRKSYRSKKESADIYKDARINATLWKLARFYRFYAENLKRFKDDSAYKVCDDPTLFVAESFSTVGCLNEKAEFVYTKLVDNILAEKHNFDETTKAQVQSELAEADFKLGEYEKAKENYEKALETLQSHKLKLAANNQSTLDNDKSTLLIKKELLKVLFKLANPYIGDWQTKLEAAKSETGSIIELSENISKVEKDQLSASNITEDEKNNLYSLYAANTADNYKELSKIYEEYTEIQMRYIGEVLDNKKLEISQRNNPTAKEQRDKESKLAEVIQELKWRIGFGLYSFESELVEKDELLEAIKPFSASIREIAQKTAVFSTIAENLKSIDSDTATSTEMMSKYATLASAYLAVGQVKNARGIIEDSYKWAEKSNDPLALLNALVQTARFYRSSKLDLQRSTELYKDFDERFQVIKNGDWFRQLGLDEKMRVLEVVYFGYSEGGQFFLESGRTNSQDLLKAEFYFEQLDLLLIELENELKTSSDPKFTSENVLPARFELEKFIVLAKKLINGNQAIDYCNKKISEIDIKIKTIPRQTQTVSNSNSNISSNTTVKSNTSVNNNTSVITNRVSNSNTAESQAEMLISRLNRLKSYYQLSLADLYLKQNDTDLAKLQLKGEIKDLIASSGDFLYVNPSRSEIIFEEYVGTLKNIGNYLKNDSQRSKVDVQLFYQRSFELLDNFQRNMDRNSLYREDYTNLYQTNFGNYIDSGTLTVQFYEDYTYFLTHLIELKGSDAELEKKLNEAQNKKSGFLKK